MSLVASGAVEDDDLSFAPEEFEPIYLSTGEDGRELVQRGMIAEILADSFISMAMREWRYFRRFGLAHGAGYANERRLYVMIIETCESEFAFVKARIRREGEGSGGR